MKAKSSISISDKGTADQTVKNIRRATRKLYSAEEKIRIVIEDRSRETLIAELCRRAVIAQSMFTNGRRIFLRQASNAWLAMQCVQRSVMR